MKYVNYWPFPDPNGGEAPDRVVGLYIGLFSSERVSALLRRDSLHSGPLRNRVLAWGGVGPHLLIFLFLRGFLSNKAPPAPICPSTLGDRTHIRSRGPPLRASLPIYLRSQMIIVLAANGKV